MTERGINMQWMVGLTTVPERLHSTLIATITSLNKSGFSIDRLFIDGALDPTPWYSLNVKRCTTRYPKIRAYGNFILGLGELYIRNPSADRYFMVQDDVVFSLNLRDYLESCKYPDGINNRGGLANGYWNLYSWDHNLVHRPTPSYQGFYPSDQLGKGALALVFSNRAVVDLLSNQHSVTRVQSEQRGHKAIDGGVVTALTNIGYKEYVHYPSLCQHIGIESAIGNKQFSPSSSFMGEDFDCLTLINK